MPTHTSEAIDGQRSAHDMRELLRVAIEARYKAMPSDGQYPQWVYVSVLDWTDDGADDQVVYEVHGRCYQDGYRILGEGTAPAVELDGDPIETVAQTWYVPVSHEQTIQESEDLSGLNRVLEAKAKLGSGERFDKLVAELMAKGHSEESAKRLAAWIGRKKYRGRFDKLAAKGRARSRRGKESADPADPDATVDRVASRVLEARGTDDAGGRVYRTRIIAVGDSKNGKRYTEAVLRAAAPLYEGARAYDHHRTREELETSTLSGLVGSYRNVEATSDGLYADLHLLPGATHVAEALDATIAAQEAGRPALVGVSHDVLAHFRPVASGGRRLQEATQIVDVQSADIVAHPSAGGMAVRAVAGGTESQEDDVPVTKEAVLAVLKDATPDELGAVGLARAGEAAALAGPATRATESQRTTEADSYDKGGLLGSLLIERKLKSAGLEAAIEAVTGALPERITESDVDAQVAAYKAVLAGVERSGLAPTVTAQVTKESLEKKRAALDAMFSGDFSKGYRGFREAYLDWTGYRPQALGADLNRQILRESFGVGFDSDAGRVTESMDSTSWAQALGDSITRRLVASYQEPALNDWRPLVSSVTSLSDFRTQRIDRIGGYGTLPEVNEGSPYQPLTSPTDEEVTYAPTKRGGTEDVTIEMIANDDLRAIAGIPGRLGMAAKRTLYLFVFELLRPSTADGPLGDAGNPTIYDGTALYASGHSNTATDALSQTALSARRTAMRKQSGYGDSKNILSVTPRTLVVPSSLEELAYQLTTSAVAIPSTPAGPSDTPNIHRGMDVVVVDYWDSLSSTGWIVVADPAQIPTLEIGFYQGRQDPELFTQSDQSQGSMFSADKYTYKIRHIYGGAILDYRAFQRGNA